MIRKTPIRLVTSFPLKNFYDQYKKELKLELINSPIGLSRTINEPTINRPGLALAGFFSYFAHKRIQVFGAAEGAYLCKLPTSMAKTRITKMLKYEIPCLVFSADIELPDYAIENANQHNVCLFRTEMVTMKFVNMATIILENEFAPSTSMHGVMLDIRGIGVLVCGKSGVGKSETALGLIERGASLVADDKVIIHNRGGQLIATAPKASRGYMEVRGLGIVNISKLFGMKAVRFSKRVDLIVILKELASNEEKSAIDRLGLERQQVEVLGENITCVELPVAPGRDTARLVEVAAMDQLLKDHGFDMAKEFNRRLMRNFTMGET